MSDIDYTAMTDAELDVAEGELAAERTRVRLEQNKVSSEKELRRMLQEMSGAARQALVLRLSGSAGSVGETAASPIVDAETPEGEPK